MWEIHPLDLGTATLKHSLLVAETADVDGYITAPSIAWLLMDRTKKQTVLVDAGPCAKYEWGVRYHNGFFRNSNQNLREQLKVYNLSPEDIDCVILTHLHWDHAYGVLELPNAQVILQKEELRYAIDPLEKDRVVYEVSIKDRLPFFFQFYHRMKTVEGDFELFDGLWLVTLPGHTPGSQGVLVETINGKFLIAGDIIGRKENWERKLLSGIAHNKEDYLKSFEKIESLSAQVLPSHDYSAWNLLGEENEYQIESRN